ncbi:hypothetical protein J2Z83_000083 [Virgibacillus natechei]|uniref:Uncharacterized protein n=1 Tax=Virgibacillus natechei TaxID=1216297 RepID=A0ABS4IC04_9BACI|nr:hypothetical protein [Virgibacillus natechei]MBP1967991.1 hypothetical protein [Virgibacillus natechei]UZD14725.1 hypothetical protein OLD84_09580 [Virgibacillus natechei]
MDYEFLYGKDAEDLTSRNYYSHYHIINNMRNKLIEIGCIKESEITAEVIKDIDMIKRLTDQLDSKIDQVKDTWRVIEKVEDSEMNEEELEKLKGNG